MVVVGATLLRALRTLRPPTPAGASGRLSVLPPVLSRVWTRTCPVRTAHVTSAVCAGHNKWSKVKNIKGPKDDARARVFQKLAMLIRIAVKEGGPNPEMNANLAQVLQQCRNNNMPKASVETAIKSAEKAKPASQHVYEARGPGGCLLLIEVLTDNSSSITQEIRRLLNKNRGMMCDKARKNFNERGVVVVSGQDVTTEKALELAIEAGAEDVQNTEDEEDKPQLQFTCAAMDLHKVRGSLQGLGMQIESAGLEFVPHHLISLDDEQMEEASFLIEALNDCPDVVRVWDNIQADS